MIKIFNSAIICIISLFFVFDSCKHDTQTPSSVITIDGFLATDYAGNPVAQFGPADNDWTFSNTLSAKEMSLFDFNTSYSLNNTATFQTTQTFHAYPNPCKTGLFLECSAPDSVLYKIVITDSNLVPLKQIAVKTTTLINEVDVSDRNLFPIGSSRRVYYSLSAKDALNFKVGYGDIKLCDEEDASKYASCF